MAQKVATPLIQVDPPSFMHFFAENEGEIREKMMLEMDDILIKASMAKYGNNQTRIAEALGVNRGTLRTRMKKLGYL